MGFKQRVGNFLLLFGFIGLLIFVASVLAPGGNWEVSWFLVGALMFGLGLNFRLSKASGAPHAEAHSAPPAGHKPAGKPAGKGGPPKPGGGGGGPPKAAAPQRKGLLSTILKGPPPKRTAPPPPKPGGGGGPPKKK